MPKMNDSTNPPDGSGGSLIPPAPPPSEGDHNRTPSDEGYCYLRAFKEEFWPSLAGRLRAWPYWQWVLDVDDDCWNAGVWLSLAFTTRVGHDEVIVHFDRRVDHDMRPQFRGWQGRLDLHVFHAQVAMQTSWPIRVGGSTMAGAVMDEPTKDEGDSGVAFGPELELKFERSCWKCLFQYQPEEDVSITVGDLKMALIGQEEEASHIQVRMVCFDNKLHLENPEGLPMEGAPDELFAAQRAFVAKKIPGCFYLLDLLALFDDDAEVGLTSLLVLGTIGDVQPTVEAASSTYMQSMVERSKATEVQLTLPATDVILMGHGFGVNWDVLPVWDPRLAVAMEPFFLYTLEKFSIRGSFLNQLATCPWQVTQNPNRVLVGDAAAGPASFADDEFYVFVKGDVDLIPLPPDAVLATHPEHLPWAKDRYPGLECVPVPVEFGPFIKLGQDMMSFKHIWGVSAGVSQMAEWLESALLVFIELVQQSGLTYAVSGSVVHAVLLSLFPGRQLVEVAPVPRSASELCPAFYLSGLTEGFGLDPKTTTQLADMLTAWLTRALRRRTGLDLYVQPLPVVQCAPYYALEAYGANGGFAAGFKPWSKMYTRDYTLPYARSNTCELCENPQPGWAPRHDGTGLQEGEYLASPMEWSPSGHPRIAHVPTTHSVSWQGVALNEGPCRECGKVSGLYCKCQLLELTDVPDSVLWRGPCLSAKGTRLKVYFSMGSCQFVNKAAEKVAGQLTALDCAITVDERWRELFPAGRCHVVPFIDHTTELHHYDVVVHHGGAGITYTCFEVGVWQFVLPQIGDQFEWRKFVKRTGVWAGDVSQWPSRAGTTPGWFRRFRARATPLECGSRWWVLKHWRSTPLPKLPARELWELATAAEQRPGNKYVEAWWHITNSIPPHYEMQHDDATQIWANLLQKYGADEDDVLQRIGQAVFAEIGFGSAMSIIKQLPLRSVLTITGAKAYGGYLSLLRDAMRHYSDFAKACGVDVGHTFPPPLPTATYMAYVPTWLGLPWTLKNVAEFDAWRLSLPQARPGFDNLNIHLRSIKFAGLGRQLGLLHAVVEFRGRWFELHRVRSGKVLICEWGEAPAVDTPILKTIVVPVPTKAPFELRTLSRLLDGNTYRAAGDNCLFFANLMVYHLTKTVVPWHHFGLYGSELPMSLRGFAGMLIEGNLILRDDEHPHPMRALRTCPTNKFTLAHLGGTLPGRPDLDLVPKVTKYGQKGYWKVVEFLSSPEVVAWRGALASPENIGPLFELATSRYGMTSGVIHRALSWGQMHNVHFAADEMDMLVTIGKRLAFGLKNPLSDSYLHAFGATHKWWGTKGRKKVVWAPLVSIHTPHHWLYKPEGGKFYSTFHPSDNVSLAAGYHVEALDLKQILENYKGVFPEVAFPDIQLKRVHSGEYHLQTRVPIRTCTAEMDEATGRLVNRLLEASGGSVGVFSLRYATPDMAEAVTNRYFTGVPEGFLSEEAKDELARGIFESNPTRYSGMRLSAPEDVFKHWHTKYSAGFPYRFNEKGNAKRADLIAAAGGKKEFLAAIRRYISDPAKYPTVSHAFVKEEVLPEASREAGKVRTIMAQDVLAYFTQMCVEGDLSKRLDPSSFSAVGVSPQHGHLAGMAAGHKKFQHHYASDITALDSRLSKDYLDVVTRVRKLGFAGHPQEHAACELLDVAAENLYTSWVVDIHSGRARLKRQGATTGHATTTGTNTIYVEVMFLDAWVNCTGRTVEEFYEQVKVSTYSDDNMWSTNLPRQIWGPEVLQDYLATKGVHLKLEAEGEKIDDIPFLAKWFSTKVEDRDHVFDLIGHRPDVCVIHDKSRLVMKFSDLKGKSTLTHRWDRGASFLENCAHHPDMHKLVWDYLHTELAPRMARRKDTAKWMAKRQPKSYEDVLRLMYLDVKGPAIVPRPEDAPWDKFVGELERVRTEVLAWDGTLVNFSRVLDRWRGFLLLSGFKVDSEGSDATDYSKAALDPEFILERHLYMHAGCPDSMAVLATLRRQSPFSAFMRLEEFYIRRHNWTYTEEELTMLNTAVGSLMLVYAAIAALESQVYKLPIVGPLYKLATSLKGVTHQAYANLNAAFYTLFGCSSSILSGLMPRDQYENVKFLAVRVWGQWTHMFERGPSIDWAALKEMVDAWLGAVGMTHALAFEQEWWVLAPSAKAAEADDVGTPGKLDHSEQVREVEAVLERGVVPVVTAPTGAGKSTDFILDLKARFTTVYLSMPRRILVQNNPVVETRCFQGSKDTLRSHAINGATHGYLRVALGGLGPNDVIVLDEFHEMDEDSLALLERYAGQVIVVTATPTPQPGFEEVRLTRSRVSGFNVTQEIRSAPGRLEDKVIELVRGEFAGQRTMVIVPSLKKVRSIQKSMEKQAPGITTQLLHKNATVPESVQVYLCTSVVDAGITIPGVQVVIDSGQSVGWKNGVMATRPSSRATSAQRAGRTGRTCDGRYVRLSRIFDETKQDFSSAFSANHHDLAVRFGETRRFPRYEELVPWLPGLYNEFVVRRDFSACVFWWMMTESRGNVQTARERYHSMQAHPEKPEWAFIFEMYGNPDLQEYSTVLGRVKDWQPSGNWLDPKTGNLTALELPPVKNHVLPAPPIRYNYRAPTMSDGDHVPIPIEQWV